MIGIHLGRNNPNYGKHTSEETRAKMRQASIRPEIRERNRLAHLGTKASEQTRAIVSWIKGINRKVKYK